MNTRRNRQLLEIAQPALAPQEHIELTGMANTGTVSVKRQVLTTALVGVLSAGMVIATVQPRPMYWVLTAQRLLFFDGKTATGKPGKLLMALPREMITAAPLSKALLGLGLKTVLSVQGEDKGLKMVFPPAAKAAGRDFAARIPTAS
ncbi:hypothetical protein QMK19_20880 [Streptomyces sp. H10-C2]|uniref:hypothetical protein n=1 Tax=unclassified Streptomyces TaxID=2593676 RepID=UPI0024B8D51A|nr:MULTISPECIES: hypothetical protein [unclassified Streptomyces]MDJ0344459.1 hypothetical protein [Streptomyces sp. PH10-H1]MDJ0372065.1 hypothetical protein [Streptomyces sp. H10-C2]